MCQLYSFQGGFDHIRLIDDLIIGEIHIHSGCDLTNLRLITYQDCICNAQSLGFMYSFQYRTVLCYGDCNSLPPTFFYFCYDVIKIHFLPYPFCPFSRLPAATAIRKIVR